MAFIISLISLLLFISCQSTNEDLCPNPRRLILACPDGYEEESPGNCKDIDECATNNGGCSGVCVNEVGSYSCLKSPPDNDDICNATDITASNPFNETIINAYTVGATVDTNITGTHCGTNITSPGVWYRLLIPNGYDRASRYIIKTQNNKYDTKLSAFVMINETCNGTLICIDGSDNARGVSPGGSKLILTGRGDEIYVLLHGSNATGITDLVISTAFIPTTAPTLDPTANPTTFIPTADPTANPTSDPTTDPTANPTTDPTADPTADPTNDPTNDATDNPTVVPTADPTSDPTNDPTSNSTEDPTSDPSSDPTKDPTIEPTTEPTIEPTQNPTEEPTISTIDTTNNSTEVDNDSFSIKASLSIWAVFIITIEVLYFLF